MMFGNLEFGVCKDVSISHLGIAVRNSEGRLVSYDKSTDSIVDVEMVDFEVENMVFLMPCAIKDIKVGDSIKHTNGHIVFVTSTEGGIHVVDVAESEKKEILPVKSLFGFDFVTKVVSMFDNFAATANESQPFGNMLPFLLLSKGNKDKKDNILPWMFLMNNNGSNNFKFDMSNPFMMLALMGGSEGKNFFPWIMMMNQNQNQIQVQETKTETVKMEKE